jgi:hypothetical protein
MGVNGTKQRCAAPSCPFGAADYFTRDLCEEHFQKKYEHPLIKQISQLQGELTKLQEERRKAKLEYGIKPEPIWYHCHNMERGCPFKTLVRDTLVRIHEPINCKFKKAPIQHRDPNKPSAQRAKADKATLSPQMMTDED